MVYYSPNNEILEFRNEDYECTNYGDCANIYKYENELIIKKYYEYVKEKYRLNKDIFDILRDIDNTHFIKIINIYMRQELIENNSKFITDIYTAKFYNEDKTNILYENINYIFENLYEIEKLGIIFSNNGIEMSDLKRKNVIINENGIILIDPDCYKLIDIKNNIEELIIINKRQILELFKNIFIKSFGYSYNNKLNEQILELFEVDLSSDPNTEISDKIYKKLSIYKKAIDYFKK